MQQVFYTEIAQVRQKTTSIVAKVDSTAGDTESNQDRCQIGNKLCLI